MRFSLRADRAALDVQVTSADTAVTIGDLFAAAGLNAIGSSIDAGGFHCDPSTPLDALDLADGAVIVSRHRRFDVRSGRSDGDRVAELVCIAGPGAGRSIELSPGTSDVCMVPKSAEGRPLSALFRVVVGIDGRVTIGSLNGSTILLDGEPAGETPEPGSWVAVNQQVFRVERIEAGRVKPRAASIAGGRSSFVRPPRLVTPIESDPVLAPKPPQEPRDPEPLSLLLLILPLPVGIIMAFFFSPMFLIFTLLSPIMAVGRNVDGKRKKRRRLAENIETEAEDLAEFLDALTRRRTAAAQQARADRPDLASMAEMARTGHPDLWRSRNTHDDFLRPVIGVGSTSWHPEILGDLATDALNAAAIEASSLPMTPVTVDLREGIALGIVGPPTARRSLAAAALSHLTVEHGPGDVELALLLSAESVRFWDHLKWLPHLTDESGSPRLATSLDQAERLAGRVLPERDTKVFQPKGTEIETPVPFFLVDAEDVVRAGVRPLAARFPRLPGRAIVLAETIEELPAFCTVVAEIDHADGEITLTDVMAGTQSDGIVGLFVDRNVAADTCRSLARFVDPESRASATSLPDSARLKDILGIDHTADDLVAAWSDPPKGCLSVLGVSEAGPLQVEFLRDGPHALVAGTTGAGKSELLRSMIVSLAAHYGPDLVTFVLVDFKGGGAFDVFQHLPHNVGVVTDLDEHLSGRALRCLQAELKYRELRLRDAGVSDLVDMPSDAEPLPRLLIVVDEFATLAAELPDFMNSLVDVAQRGRSLGIHMVLATQRPTGVVDAKIRANTNLRIALRVQDDGDSMDVIGAKSAADIDRRHPGRAFARFGASELVGFQTALVSVQTRTEAGPALHLDPFELLNEPLDIGIDQAGPPEDGSDTGARTNSGDNTGDNTGGNLEDSDLEDSDLDDLGCYVIAAGEAAGRLGIAAPRVPWPDPLPESLAAEDLLADAGPGRLWSVPYGLTDLPDRQCQEPAWWGPGDGNVIVYGIEPGASPAVVTTIVLGLAHRHRADRLHLYVIDFAGSLAALRGLPHLGGYVSPDDDERLMRTVQFLEGELDRRRRLVEAAQIERLGPDVTLSEPTPLVTVVIANYGAVLEMFEELGELGGPGRLAQIVRDGPALGVFVFIAATSERDVPNRVAQQIEAKLIMRMADPNSYLMFGLKTKDVPDLVPGRAIDIRTGDELQIARFGGGDLRSAIESTDWNALEHRTDVAVEEDPVAARGLGPTKVDVLETEIDFEEVRSMSRIEPTVWHLSIGIAHDDLTPVGLDLRTGRHVVVTGPSGSGKTSTLIAMAAAARATDPAAYLAVESARPEEWDHVREELDITNLEFLMAPDSPSEKGRRTLIIIDGIESVPVPTDIFNQLTAQPIGGLHIVVAGRGDSFRGHDPWIRAVCSHRTGVALQATPDQGDLFRCRFPTPKGLTPAGRGYLVNEGIANLAQVALVSSTDLPTDRLLAVAGSQAGDVRPRSTSGV